MLSALLIAALALIALLAVPVTLDFQLNWRRRLQGEASLQWLFGLVRVRLAPPRARKAAAGKKQADDSAGPRPRPPRKRFEPLAALRQADFRRRLLRFARQLWRAFRKRDLLLRIRVGLGDPADTGRLWALLGPLSGLLAGIEEASIELEADFVDAVFEVDSRGKVSVIPLQLLGLLLGLLLSPPFWRGLQRMHRAA